MKKAIEMMQKIQVAISGFFLCVFLLTVVFQMLSRYMGIAATWTEDVSMYSFIWLCVRLKQTSLSDCSSMACESSDESFVNNGFHQNPAHMNSITILMKQCLYL